MRLRAATGAQFVNRYGQHSEVQEMKYNGEIIFPVYSLELSVSSIIIPANGDGSTISVYGVARNENGEEIRRVQLTYPEVEITKTGADEIKNSVFTFYADNRGTAIGDVLTATYTITWKGCSAQLVVKQDANSRRQTARRNYFTLTETSGNVLTFLAGSKYEVDTNSHRYSVGCYYEIDYLYKSGATFTDKLNGAIKSKSGSTSWNYYNGILSIGSNGGSTSRTCTLTAYFPTSAYSGTLIVAQVKPAVIVYGVGWSSYTMRQVGGKKVFNFEITYNNNLRGANITFEAIKVNNGVTTTIKTLTATMSGNSFAVTDDSFAGNDATASGDAYYITFAYDSQTFTSPELANEYYLDNPRIAYSSDNIINAAGSNYAYLLADLMRGGTATQSGVICSVAAVSGSGFSVANGRVYGSNRGIVAGDELSCQVISASYQNYTIAPGTIVKQQANAVVSTAHSYDYVITGLASPFTSSAPALSKGQGGGITYTSCKQYDTPRDTYTSGSTNTRARSEVGSVTPSFSNSASWITMSGSYVTCAKQAKTGTARNATITLTYNSVTIGSVIIYQAATTKTYSLTVSSSATSVGAGGGSATLSATGVTSWDNGDASESTALTTGWTCTNTGSLVGNKWSVSGNTATAATLGTIETTGANVGVFSLSWNGVTRTLNISQAQNVKTEGATTGVLSVDGTEYTSSQTLNVTYARHEYAVIATARRNYTYTSGASSSAAVTPSVQASGTGYSFSNNVLVITENSGSAARTGYLNMSYNGSTIIALTIAQAAYVPVDRLSMVATYMQLGGRKTFSILVGYSDSLRGQPVFFQPYKLNGGTRTNLGAGVRQTMPTSGNTTELTITVASSTATGDTFRVEATTSRVLADVEATMEEL